MFKKASKGIVGLKPHHVARSTAITNMIDAYGLRVAQQQAGYKSMRVTNQYNQNVDLVKVRSALVDTSTRLGEKSGDKM
jgi:hypothetical protein